MNAHKMTFHVEARRLDAHGSLARCKSAEIALDTDLAGNPDSLNPAELLLAANGKHTPEIVVDTDEPDHKLELLQPFGGHKLLALHQASSLAALFYKLWRIVSDGVARVMAMQLSEESSGCFLSFGDGRHDSESASRSEALTDLLMK